MKDVGHRMIHSESKIYENLRYDSSSKECSQGQVFCVFQKPILTEKGLIENVSERSGIFNNFLPIPIIFLFNQRKNICLYSIQVFYI